MQIGPGLLQLRTQLGRGLAGGHQQQRLDPRVRIVHLLGERQPSDVFLHQARQGAAVAVVPHCAIRVVVPIGSSMPRPADRALALSWVKC